MSEVLLSIVVPVFNEEEVLATFHQRLTATLNELPVCHEVVYVNDGSSDATATSLEHIYAQSHSVSVIELSRNFGKEAAMTAGLEHACGDAVVVIDADLQDPPELIIEMLTEWNNGFDVVYAKRSGREGESWLKKITASAFYRLINASSDTHLPPDVGDFRLLSRRAVNALSSMPERNRYMKGMFAWIGFPQKAIEYKRQPRHAGKSQWSYFQLWKFAIDGFTSFSSAPIKIATYFGATAAALSLIYAAYVILETVLLGNPVAGYPSLLVAIFFFGGIQLLFMGILGTYLARTYEETKSRPLYVVKASLISNDRASGGSA